MSVEKKIKAASGWGVLFGCLAALVVDIALFVGGIMAAINADETGSSPTPAIVLIVAGVLLLIA